jgi:hypothetical protein
VWVLDCCSVVPIRYVTRSATHRAYAYEAAIKPHLPRFASSLWRDAEISPAVSEASTSLELVWPFQPVELGSVSIGDLVAECDGCDQACYKNSESG